MTLSAIFRSRWRLPAVLAVAAGLALATPGVAHAVTGTGKFTLYIGPNSSDGIADWNGSTDKINVLAVSPGGGFASGKCLDTIFDWHTTGGHFDPRIVRTCNGSVAYYGNSNDANMGRSLDGMNKGGVCYGTRNSTNSSAANCKIDSRGGSILRSAGGPNTSLPNNCARSWRIEAGSGDAIYNSGGASTSCDS